MTPNQARPVARAAALDCERLAAEFRREAVAHLYAWRLREAREAYRQFLQMRDNVRFFRAVLDRK